MPTDGLARIESLERLANLLEDGRISQEEFERLKADLLDPSAATPSNMTDTKESAPIVPDTPLLGDSVQPRPNGGRTATAADGGPTVYKLALGLGIASIFLGGTFGLLAWSAVAASGYALYSVKTPNRRWMAWTGLALGIVFSFMNAYLNGHLDSLVGGGEAWTPPDTSITIASCEEQGASDNCAALVDALRVNGCTVSDAALYIEEEARKRSLNPASLAKSNPIYQRMQTPRGVAGAASHCEFQKEFGHLSPG